MVPVLVLNSLGVIAGAIWLAALGRWGTLGLGVVAMILGGLLLSLLMMPILALALPMNWLLERNRRGAALLVGAFVLLLNVAIVAGWMFIAFWYFVGNGMRPGDSLWTLLPLMLWAYGVASAPVSFLASKEQEGSAATLVTFFAELGLVALMFVAFLAQQVRPATLAFWGVVAAGYLLQLWVANATMREAAAESQVGR
jgi:hypothetical protein